MRARLRRAMSARMGNRRFRRNGEAFDDVADIVSAAAEAVRNRAGEEGALQRQREREEKRLRWEARQRRQILSVGAGLLAGGLAASSGLITVAAVGVGLLTGTVVSMFIKAFEDRAARPSLLQRGEAPRPRLADPVVPGDDPRAALIRTVVAQAMGHLRTVDAAARTINDVETAAVLTRIAAIGTRVCQAVAAQPAGFDAAQRALTYHAEKAAQLAQMAGLSGSAADTDRMANVRRILSRMERLFEETEEALQAEDLREVDLDLKLMDQALDEDLNRTRRP